MILEKHYTKMEVIKTIPLELDKYKSLRGFHRNCQKNDKYISKSNGRRTT